MIVYTNKVSEIKKQICADNGVNNLYINLQPYKRELELLDGTYDVNYTEKYYNPIDNTLLNFSKYECSDIIPHEEKREAFTAFFEKFLKNTIISISNDVVYLLSISNIKFTSNEGESYKISSSDEWKLVIYRLVVLYSVKAVIRND